MLTKQTRETLPDIKNGENADEKLYLFFPNPVGKTVVTLFFVKDMKLSSFLLFFSRMISLNV